MGGPSDSSIALEHQGLASVAGIREVPRPVLGGQWTLLITCARGEGAARKGGGTNTRAASPSTPTAQAEAPATRYLILIAE